MTDETVEHRFTIVKIDANDFNIAKILNHENSTLSHGDIFNILTSDEISESACEALKKAIRNSVEEISVDMKTLGDSIMIMIGMVDDLNVKLVGDTLVCYNGSHQNAEIVCIDSQSYGKNTKPLPNNLAMYLAQNNQPIYGCCSFLMTKYTYITDNSGDTKKQCDLIDVTVDGIYNVLHSKFVKKGLSIKNNTLETVLYSPETSVTLDGFEHHTALKVEILKHTLVMYVYMKADFKSHEINKYASALLGTKLVYGDVFIKLIGEQYEDFDVCAFEKILIGCSPSAIDGAYLLSTDALKSPYDMSDREKSLDKHHIIEHRYQTCKNKNVESIISQSPSASCGALNELKIK